MDLLFRFDVVTWSWTMHSSGGQRCRKHVQNQKQETRLSLTNRATHLCNDPLKHALPHMCYHIEFGHSARKYVGIN